MPICFALFHVKSPTVDGTLLILFVFFLFPLILMYLMCAVSSYVLLHASRKTFSNVKVSISAQWTPAFYNASASPVEVSGCSVASKNIIAPEIWFSLFAVRPRLTSDCDCLRGGTATPCLQMRSRPRCSWELWTPSSSSRTLW